MSELRKTSRISAISIKKVERRLQETFRISSKPIDSLEHVFVFVETEGGTAGLGEASPLGPLMGDSAHLIDSAVNELSPHLIGQSVFDVNLIRQTMNATLRFNYSAKAAIDIAIYDAASRILSVPTHELLGGHTISRLASTWVIGIKALDATLEEGVSAVERGYGTLKVKIGGDDEEDVERVLQLRSEVGAAIRIRVDANQAYSAPRAIRVLKKLEQADLEFVEQPCHAEDLAGARRVRETVGIPVLADESIFGPRDVVAVSQAGAADAVNIKIAKTGGISGAMEVASVAHAFGMPVVVGSSLELTPGISAGLHFGFARGVEFACDVYAGHHHHQDADSVSGGLVAPQDGFTDVPSGIGLGFDAQSLWDQL